MTGMLRAVAPPTGAPLVRTMQIVRGVPRLVTQFKGVIAAVCEVAQMLSDRVGLPASTSTLFAHMGERWDGRGVPGRVQRGQLPLPMRIVHVARDAALQRLLHGETSAAEVVRERAGGAFDPDIAVPLAEHAAAILDIDAHRSVWDAVLTCEPAPRLVLEAEQVDRALVAMGDFADLVSTCWATRGASRNSRTRQRGIVD
jgi:hypothetical protein